MRFTSSCLGSLFLGFVNILAIRIVICIITQRRIIYYTSIFKTRCFQFSCSYKSPLLVVFGNFFSWGKPTQIDIMQKLFQWRILAQIFTWLFHKISGFFKLGQLNWVEMSCPSFAYALCMCMQLCIHTVDFNYDFPIIATTSMPSTKLAIIFSADLRFVSIIAWRYIFKHGSFLF